MTKKVLDRTLFEHTNASTIERNIAISIVIKRDSTGISKMMDFFEIKRPCKRKKGCDCSLF